MNKTIRLILGLPKIKICSVVNYWDHLRQVFLLHSLNNQARRIRLEGGQWLIITPSPSEREGGFDEISFQDRNLNWHEIPYGRKGDSLVFLRRGEEVVYATWFNSDLHGVQRRSFFRVLKAARNQFNKVEYHGLDEKDYLLKLAIAFNVFLNKSVKVWER